MLKRLLLLVPFFLLAPYAKAQDDAAANLQGTWKLKSFYMVDEETKEKKATYGEQPNGYLTLLSNGRMFLVMTGTDRPKKPETDADPSSAYKSMVAYTGTYRLEGDAFITKVDTAWNEAWVGTDQKRIFKVEGDTLTVTSMTQPAVNFDNRMMHGEQVWERVK